MFKIKEESHTPYFKSKKLGVIKFSEAGMLKVERGQKQDLVCQLARCECKGKVHGGNERCSSSEHTNDEKARRPYCGHGESFRGQHT